MLAQVAFGIIAAGMIGSGLMAVTSRNLVRSVLWLAVTLPAAILSALPSRRIILHFLFKLFHLYTSLRLLMTQGSPDASTAILFPPPEPCFLQCLNPPTYL